jgi:hypothetical protein
MTQEGVVTRSDPLVFVDAEFSECGGRHEVRVHHRDWPELYGEGETTREAVQDLLRRLFSQWDCVVSNWHRQGLERVIAETQDFLD